MRVLAAAFVPSAPVLVPELAGGAAAELDGVRAAADAAVLEVVATAGPTETVIVLGAGPVTATYPGAAGGTFAPWGVDVRVGGAEPAGDLPLSLTMGAWWLDRAGVPLSRRAYRSVGDGDRTDPAPGQDGVGDCVLVVVGDGSSTRTPKAPGSFRPEAADYDGAVVTALAGGDPAVLTALDDARARVVGADAPLAWTTMARWWGPAAARAARVDADEAPYGVEYLVGVWKR